MWRLPTLSNEIVGITYTHNALTCSWIRKAKQDNRAVLMAYRRTPCNAAIMHQSRLFNPTVIRSHIHSFMQAHSLTNACVLFSLSGQGIVEDFIRLRTQTPKQSDIALPNFDKVVWDLHYLYPDDDGYNIFYVCGMRRELVTQYTLLATSLNLNLIAITPQFMSYLYLYRHIYGRAFRHAQLASDMRAHNNHLERFFTKELIFRLLRVSGLTNLSLEHELSFLVNALGLFLLGHSDYEKDELHFIDPPS